MIAGEFGIGRNRAGQVVVRLDDKFSPAPVEFIFSVAQARDFANALIDIANKAEDALKSEK